MIVCGHCENIRRSGFSRELRFKPKERILSAKNAKDAKETN